MIVRNDMNKILIYAHYNKNTKLAEHVAYQLQQMKPLFKKAMLLSNSELGKK